MHGPRTSVAAPSQEASPRSVSAARPPGSRRPRTRRPGNRDRLGAEAEQGIEQTQTFERVSIRIASQLEIMTKVVGVNQPSDLIRDPSTELLPNTFHVGVPRATHRR